jgi:hypothetical protein
MPAPGFHEKGPEVALDIEQLLYEGTFPPIGTQKQTSHHFRVGSD